MKTNKLMIMVAIAAIFGAVVMTGCTPEAAPAETGGTTAGEAKPETSTTSTPAESGETAATDADAGNAADDGHDHAAGESH